MAGVSPTTAYSPAAPPALTTSPFSFSVASTRWSSTLSIHLSNLFLRDMALLLSFVSTLSLVGPSTKKKGEEHFSFHKYHRVNVLLHCIHLGFPLLGLSTVQSVCDIAYRGILISERISDYINFILDQAGYLLVSSSSATVITIQQIEGSSRAVSKVAIYLLPCPLQLVLSYLDTIFVKESSGDCFIHYCQVF